MSRKKRGQERVARTLELAREVHLHQVSNASEAIERMLSDEFRFQQEVAVFDACAETDLVPADRAGMSFEKGGFMSSDLFGATPV